MPWLIALFLCMLWLVPFDSIQLKADLPVDPKLDRLLLSVIATVWIAGILAGGRAAPQWRPGPLDAFVFLAVGIAIASVVANVAVLARVDELDLATKKLTLLLSYVTFFFIVATSLRPRELERLCALFVGLAALCATGVLLQYFRGTNLFFEWSRALLPDDLFEFQRPIRGNSFVTPAVTGPARHALALSGMFAMALSFTVVGILRARAGRRRLLYGVLFALILGGVFATSRKTGTLASASAILTLLVMRPGPMARLAPIAIAALLAATAVAPKAVEFQIEKIDPSAVASNVSSKDRKTDYAAVVPDVRKYVTLGRGFGTYDSNKYRIIDNNYLVLLLETGLIGLAAFAALILAVPLAARRAAREADPFRWAPALAAAGGAAAFGVSMVLFDALAFAQAPYMFFFLAGVVVVARSRFDEPVRQLSAAESETRVLPPIRPRRRPSLLPRREAPEHGGRRLRPGSRGRGARRAGTGRAPSPAGPEVPPPASGPAHEGRVRLPHSGRGRRNRTAAVLTALVLSAAVLVLGRGGGPAPTLSRLAPGGAAQDPFAAEGPKEPRLGEQAARPGRGRRGAAFARPAVPDPPAAPPPARSEPPATTQPRSRSERPRRKPRRKASGPARPVRPDVPGRAPVAVPGPAPDCLPGNAEQVLIQLGFGPCPDLRGFRGASMIREAIVRHPLTASEVAILERAFPDLLTERPLG